jgi:hypothetical protein
MESESPRSIAFWTQYQLPDSEVWHWGTSYPQQALAFFGTYDMPKTHGAVKTRIVKVTTIVEILA